MSERFAERRRLDKRRRRKRVLLAVLVAVVLVALVWVVWFSRVLAVQRVTVEGTTTLKPAQVRAAAAVRLGVPMARVDTVTIEARVRQMERVQGVEVSRHWPHTLQIRVNERTPVAWTRTGGEIRALDRFGVDFRTLAKEPKSLVEIRVDATDARQRQQARESASAVVDLLREKDPKLLDAVQHVEVETKDSVVLDLTKGRTITWGSAAKGEQKLRVLRALLDIKASDYDVSAPEQPTTRR